MFVSLALAMLPVLASADTTPSISGGWARADGKTRINIAACGIQLCATNTWVRDPDSDESVGDRIILTLAPNGADRGAARLVGTAFDEKRRANYSVQILVSRDQMKTQGCLVSGLLCRSMDWTRVP